MDARVLPQMADSSAALIKKFENNVRTIPIAAADGFLIHLQSQLKKACLKEIRKVGLSQTSVTNALNFFS